MTNVRRPIYLQLQRPSTAMVSSSSGQSPFGAATTDGSGGGSQMPSHTSLGGPGDAQISPPQPAPRSAPIRPNALINLNCIAKTPTIPSNLASPMHAAMMMARSSRSTGTGAVVQRPTTCCSETTPSGETAMTNYCHHSKALSPTGLNDSLPSQIMPHLFVGNQEQTNRETVNKLNIKYILSLGLLPMIVANNSTSVTTLSPVSPATTNKKVSSKQRDHHRHHQYHHHHGHHHHYHHQPQNLMPTPNSSRDFKIRIRSNTPTTPTTPCPATANNTTAKTTSPVDTSNCLPSSDQNKVSSTATSTKPRDENKGVKQVRSVYCKCINIADNSDQLLSKFFDEAYNFIEEARRKKCNILIHCLAGISRSPTVAIAYLMRIRSLHWKDAYDLVKQCRPQIDPNLNFMGQLRIYNKSLRDEHSAIASKRNGTINESVTANDCHNTIKSNKANHNNTNSSMIVGGGHQSTNTTSNQRDKDNI